jgi:type VI secretion system secreted protein VgrG
MADILKSSFSFTVQGKPASLFSVVEFEGEEQISAPYRFSLTLATREKQLDPKDVVRKKAMLGIKCPQGKSSFGGVVWSLHFLHSRNDIFFYKAVLVPHLQLLSLTQHNQVFLNLTLPQILEQVLKDSAITEYDMKLTGSYSQLEYICQYNETNLQFISRLMEQSGISYFFRQGDQGETLVMTDNRAAHMPLQDKPLLYLPPSGLDDPERDFKVSKLVQETAIVPQTVVLKSYNYQTPNLDLKVQAEVSPEGVGTHYSYGEFYQTVSEGQRLAGIRAEELLAGQEVFLGAGTSPFLAAGWLFSLAMHPLDAFNASYLAVAVEHHGRDKATLTAGLDQHADQAEEANFYRNAFRAILSHKQYRPPRVTPKQRIHGYLSAFIDAEGNGKYAFLDSMGRYKVRLPFDLAGRPDGHASCWLRLAEPYAGDGHGMHFPLLKGTEVFLSFVDGDPDRPVIASTAYNGQSPNLLQDKNAPVGVIKSAASNQIVFNDQQGREFMGMWSPFHNSGIALGSVKPGGGGSIAVQTNGDYEKFVNGGENSIILGSASEIVGGTDVGVVAGAKADVVLGMTTEVTVGSKFEYQKGPGLVVGDESMEVHDERAVQSLGALKLSAGVVSKTTAEKILTSPLVPFLSLAGAIILGATETAMSAMDTGGESDPANSAGEFFKDIGDEMGLKGLYQIIPFALEAIGLAVLAGVLDKQMDTMSKSFASNSAAVMEMNAQGMNIDINKFPLATQDVSFALSVEDHLTNQSQELKLDKTDGFKCTVSAAAVHNTFQIAQAGTATLNTQGDINLTTATQTVITSTGHGVATVGATGVKIEETAGAKVEVTSTQAKVTAPNNIDAITVSNNGIQLSFMGNNLRAGPLSINAAGMIQLG